MKKQVLIISPYNPFEPVPGAASKSLKHRIERLAQIVETTLLTFSYSPEEDAEIAFKLGVRAHFVPHVDGIRRSRQELLRFPKLLLGRLSLFDVCQKMVSALTPDAIQFSRDKRFDLVQVEDSVIASIVSRLPGKSKRLLFLHNLLTLQYRQLTRTRKSISKRIVAYWEYLWIKRFERTVLAKFDAAVVLTQIEKERALSLNPTRQIIQIPLEVDTQESKQEDIPDDSPNLAFSGTMSYYPNQEAAVHFVTNILPRIGQRHPTTKFYIVGKNPGNEVTSLSSQRVIVTGEVESVHDFLMKSNVVVVPLLNGGGMRLKILEAFSLAKPVVSTSLGAEGIAYTNGEDILIADDPESFAGKVCELLEDKEKSKFIGRNARRLVEKEYSINVVWRKWEKLYVKLIDTDPLCIKA
jgi:glycosyltransferase involved in cell wall biosynthesis